MFEPSQPILLENANNPPSLAYTTLQRLGDVNPICTLGDYSKPSHKGYRNTIELRVGNNVAPLRSDTIRLVQNECSFHGLWSEDLNQHLKDFLKLVDSLDLDGENKERTRLCLFQFSLRDQASNWLERLSAGSCMGGSYYSNMDSFQGLTSKIPSSWHRSLASNSNFYDHVSFHLKCEIDCAGGDKLRNKNADESWEIIKNLALYDHEGWNDSKEFDKPVKAIFTPICTSKTPDRRLLELKDQINFLLKGARPTPRHSSTHIPQAYPEGSRKVLIREEAKAPVTKNVNSISLAKKEEERNDNYDMAADGDINGIHTEMPIKEVEKEIKAENETKNKPIKRAEREEIAKASSSQPVGYYLKHRINEKLIEGLVDNHRNNRGHVSRCCWLCVPVDFMILDIKEDEKRPFILGTPFLMTAKAVIKFDKGTITLRSGKSKISFHMIHESLCKVEKGIKNDIEPIAPTITVNWLVLEWEEKLKLHQENEMKFDQ
nr:MAK10-like protein [Tanacetum cinerariifolium]